MRIFLVFAFFLFAAECLLLLVSLGSCKYPVELEPRTQSRDAIMLAVNLALAVWAASLLWVEKGGAS